MARENLSLDVVLLLLLLAVGAAVEFRDLGAASFYGDEAIYAQVARESASGDWLPPRFNGEIHLHKPPLRSLVTAALFRTFGEGEGVARVPDALLTLALVALVFWQGRRWFGRWAASLGALLPLGAENLLFHHGLRDAVQEGAVVFLGTAMLLLWLRHLEAPNAGRVAVVALCGGLLGLVKNPIGVLFALLLLVVTSIDAIVARRRSLLRSGAVWLILAGSIALWASWVAYLQLVTGGYYLSVLYGDLVVRGVRGLDPTHLRTWTYYGRILADDFGWWMLLAVPAGAGVWRHLRGRGSDPAGRVRLHLAVWSGAIFVLFSLPVSKNPWYIYPAYPAMALLLASGAVELTGLLRQRRAMLAGQAAALMCAFLAADIAFAWRDAGRDVLVLDTDRFGRAYGKLEAAELHVDVEAIRRHGHFREWNWYYLSGVRDVAMGSREEELLPRDRCTFEATPDPEPFRRRGWPWRTEIDRIDPREAPLWIVGTCPLNLDDATGTH